MLSNRQILVRLLLHGHIHYFQGVMKPLSTAQASLFLPSMPDVARCELSLQELHQAWRLIEASAKMNCPVEARLLLPAMVSTRTGFSHLEGALIANLVQEKIRNVLAEIATKAQSAAARVPLLARDGRVWRRP